MTYVVPRRNEGSQALSSNFTVRNTRPVQLVPKEMESIDILELRGIRHGNTYIDRATLTRVHFREAQGTTYELEPYKIGP